MLANCDFIVIFPIYGQSGAIQKLDSECITCKAYIFINSNLLFYKIWKQNYKISNTALTLLLWVPFLLKYHFCPKMLFLQKMLTSAKLREPWY